MNEHDVFQSQPGSFEKRDMVLIHDTNYSFSLQSEFSSPIFGAIVVFCIMGAVIFMANIYTNQEIVDIEVQYGYGITVTWFLILSLISALLTAHMVYKPYIIDRNNRSNIILYALIIYITMLCVWSLALFHSRVNRGVATLASVLLLAAIVWLGWACYHLAKESIFIFVILLVWCLFLQAYTYNVDSHPWIGVPI